MIHRRKRLFSGLFISLIIVFFGIILWWNSPARTSQNATNQTTVLGTKTETASLNTSYLRTEMPDTLRLKSSTENNTNSIVGQYLLTNKNVRSNDQVGITIGKLEGNLLSDISSVQLRLRNPNTYSRLELSFAPTGSIVFSRLTDGYEKGIFWVHGDLYAAVVVSGTSDQSASLDNALAIIINGWQWR